MQGIGLKIGSGLFHRHSKRDAAFAEMDADGDGRVAYGEVFRWYRARKGADTATGTARATDRRRRAARTRRREGRSARRRRRPRPEAVKAQTRETPPTCTS